MSFGMSLSKRTRLRRFFCSNPRCANRIKGCREQAKHSKNDDRRNETTAYPRAEVQVREEGESRENEAGKDDKGRDPEEENGKSEPDQQSGPGNEVFRSSVNLSWPID